MSKRWLVDASCAVRALVLLVVLGLGCTPERSTSLRSDADASAGTPGLAVSSGPTPVPVSPSTAGQASSPINVAEVIRRVHFAFRPEGDAFAGGHKTYGVRGSAQGQLAFTPYRRATRDAEPSVGKSFSFETKSLVRGKEPLAVGDPKVRVDDEGVLSIARGDVLERLRNGDEGVEQTWTFAEPPSGKGDLTVRLRVGGLSYVGRTSGGLHFVDEQSKLGVRYGAATWVDAEGRRFPVVSRYEEGELLLTVAAADVEQAKYPAVLDPTISGEYGMDNPISGAAPGQEAAPAIAFGGGNFFVVWEDDRAGVNNVYGARVSPAGTVLDIAGIPIASGSVSTHMNCGIFHCGPQVAFDGTNFLVVWLDVRNGAANNDVFGRFVSAAGGTVVGADFPVNAAAADQAWIGIGFDGTNYLVVWTEMNPSYAVRGSLISKAGVVQGTPGFTVTTEFTSYVPSVAFDGTNYMVVWEYLGGSRRQIHGTLVSKTGTLPVPAGFNFSSGTADQQNPSITYDATSSNYFIAYEQDAGSSNYNIYGKRISTAGVVVAADASGIAIGTAPGYAYYANVTFDGANNFYVVWYASGARGARVSKTGTLLDGPSTNDGVSVAASGVYPVVAFGGGTYLVASKAEYYTSPSDVIGTLVTAGGVVGSTFPIAKTANAQHAPAVAFDGTNYLIVWEDYRPGVTNLDIYGARVSKAGAVQDTSGISIATATGNQVAPAVVFDGSSYYVVWEDHRAANAHIYGSPVSKLGVVGDPVGLLISAGAPASSTDQFVPTVGFNGADYWVAWEDYRNGATADIYGARVTTGGTLRDGTGVALTTAALDQKAPSAACDGTNCLVVWQDYRGGASYDIYGARMAPGGGFVAPADNAGIAISAAAFDQKSPAIAFDGNDYFAVWSDARATGLNPDIYGARVSKAGAILDAAGVAISTAAGDQTMPAVAYAGDGVNYVVAWADKRGTSNDIYASWVSTGGSVLDPTGVQVTTDTKDEVAPAIATEGAGHSIITYQRFDPLSPFGVERVRAKLAYSGTLVGSGCAGGSTCATRFCSESYCCDKACTGACQTCGATPGTCTSVVNGDDPDHCPMATSVCDGTGACKLKQGQACMQPGTNCLSGYCVDGYCCDKQCAGGCDECASTPGTCKVVGAGNGGANPPCNPGVCDGASPNCPGGCTSDSGCGAGTYCAAGGTCQPQRAQGQACNLVTDCTEAGCRECTSGNCVDGFCCDTACAGACDTCSATPGTCKLLLKAVDGSPTCSPYLCTGMSATCGNGCADDSECVANHYCDTMTGKCAPDQAAGKGCTSKTQCQSGFCVDGVCCDEACGGTCRACTAALKGRGLDGTCDDVKAGIDLANECPSDAPSTCKLDGQCDGAGACRKYAKGSSCGATSCVGNNVIGQVCDGLGSCGLDNMGIDCSPHVCGGGQCKNPCQSVSDCVLGNICVQGTCAPKLPIASECLIGLECTSGSCVEGICCDTGCSGLCQTCLKAHQAPGGAQGTCWPVAAGDDPRDNCADDGAGSCKKDGLCDGAGACRFYPQGASCAPPSCAINAPTKAETNKCNGAGTCETTSTECKPFACALGVCHTDCKGAADCGSTAYCNAGACEAKKKNGDPCTSDSSCTSGICADGVCCNAACKGQCEACNDMAALGTCVPVSGKPAAARMPCDAAPPADVCVATSCDGTTRDKCAGFVGPTVSCRKVGCASGVATVAASCNGKGQCPAAQTQMCEPYACDTDKCKTSCAADADCAGGFKCEMGKCVPGATCSDEHTVLGATGTSKDCSPYKCSMGACGTMCKTIDDCLAGYACDMSKACVPASGPAPGAAAEEGGCGCRLPGQSTSGRAGWLSFLAGALLLRGRTRRERGRRSHVAKG